MRMVGRWSHRYSRWIILFTFLLAGAAGWLGGTVPEKLVPYNTQNSGSESAQADELVERAARMDPNPGLIALVDIPDGVTSAESTQRITRIAGILGDEDTVARVGTTLDGRPGLVSADGLSTVVVANFEPSTDKEKQDAAQRVLDRTADLDWVRLGGYDTFQIQVNSRSTEGLIKSELVAFPIVFLLSLFFFRGIIAALVPPILGGLSVLFTFLVLRALAGVTDISIFALNLAGGLGLGLSIDYSLLFIARYREERLRQPDTASALTATLASAGRAVLFSALTISGALAALLVFPQNFLFSMGIVGVSVPIIAAVITVLVLPAALALLGSKIDAGAPKWLQRRADRDARPAESGAWYAIATGAMRRPILVALAGLLIMLVLSLPALGTKFMTADERALPKEDSARVVADALRTDFPGASRAIFVAVDGSAPAAADLAQRVDELAGVRAVTPPGQLDATTHVFSVVPDGDALERSSKDLVRDIRALPVDDGRFLVGGESARSVDQDQALVDHLPWALLVILCSVLVFIYLLTGSVILPLKSLVMNVLTVGVAFGALVFVFQHGRFESLLGYDSTGAVDATQPILITALILGLSTDYTVFLLARIKEGHDAGMGNRDAVALGVERTGRILSAAALMFCAAVGPFMAADVSLLKQIGLGLVVGVLLDAFVVRALLVPSLMALMGRWNWWAPNPLRRLHERIGIRESGPVSAPEAVEPAETEKIAR